MNPSPAAVAMGFFSRGNKHGKHDHEVSSSRRLANFTLASQGEGATRQHGRLYILVHRAHYHWEHRVPLTWLDVNLPQG